MPPPLHTTPATHHRFHLLDALRGLAAVVVVYWHAPLIFRPLHSSHNGFLAVDFFFCLSGFVLAFAYERRLAGTVNLSQFLAARLIRLYPIYFVGILLGLLLVLHAAPHLAPTLLSSSLFQFLLLPSPIARSNPPFLFPMDVPAWSIFFELIANAAYALLVRQARAGTRNLLAILTTVVIALVIYIATGHGLDAGAYWSRSIVCGFLRVILSFTAGVLVLRLTRRQQALPWTPRRSLLAATALTACLLLLLIAPFPFQQNRTFQLLTITALFPSLIYAGALCRLPSACTAACAFLGDLSYPLYLLHTHFLALLGTTFALHTLARYPLSQPLFVPAILLLAGATSFLLLKLYDTPTRALLTRAYNAHRT